MKAYRKAQRESERGCTGKSQGRRLDERGCTGKSRERLYGKESGEAGKGKGGEGAPHSARKTWRQIARKKRATANTIDQRKTKGDMKAYRKSQRESERGCTGKSQGRRARQS
jgi:hypothetical protein